MSSKNVVLSVTESTKIKDVYNQAVKAFDLSNQSPPAIEAEGFGGSEAAYATPLKKTVGFEGHSPTTKDAGAVGSPEDGYDLRNYVLTDESHNDLWLLGDVSVQSYFLAEENAKFAVFYLRKKIANQESLLGVQEESMGLKKNQNNQTNVQKNENKVINDLLDKFEKSHKGMVTYSTKFYQTLEVEGFESSFKVDILNFVLNIFILILLVVQLLLYLDTNSALIKQSWKNNQISQRIYTYSNVNEELKTEISNIIDGSKLRTQNRDTVQRGIRITLHRNGGFSDT